MAEGCRSIAGEWSHTPEFMAEAMSCWISGEHETDRALTKALQITLSSSTNSSSPGSAVSDNPAAALAAAPRAPAPPIARPGGGRIGKRRRSRASKRATTTYIAADPENFRQMVQQVTGARHGDLTADPTAAPPIARPGGGGGGGACFAAAAAAEGFCLPTLDTSLGFLLDRRTGFAPPKVAAAGSAGFGFDFEAFPSYFPLLESWETL